MHHPELPVVSFLCVLLLLCSLPSHVRAGSVATIALIAWLTVMSLIRGINALIWADNFVVRLQVWCDITTKITIGFTYAVPAAALCILRHLERVASTRYARSTEVDKRRRQVFEAVMCFGLPLFFMALHYIVQGHRYDLFEDFGCYPAVYFSVVSIIIVWAPPLVMSLITFIYASLSLRHFLKHRIEFAAHLQNSQSAITPGRYFRLMAMAVVEMIWDTGVNTYIIWFNTLTGIRPWTNWDDVHSNFSRVGVVPQFLNPPQLLTQLIWQWWIIPISCLFFFVFFAFGEEAMSDYRAAFLWIRRCILRQKVGASQYGNSPSLPSHYTHPLPFNPTPSPTLYVASKSDLKGWDELSLQMPEYGEPENFHNSSTPPPQSLLTTREVTDCSQTFELPLERSRHSASTSMSFTMAESPRRELLCNEPNAPIPSPTSCRSEADPPSTSNAHCIPSIQIPLPVMTRYPSGTISRRSSGGSLKSTSSDIIISDAYSPDTPTASQPHEAPRPSDPFAASRNSSTLSDTRPRGGIRVTVERTVL